MYIVSAARPLSHLVDHWQWLPSFHSICLNSSLVLSDSIFKMIYLMYHDSVHKIYKQHGVIGTYDNDRNVCERWEYAEMNKDVCGSLTFSPSVFFLVWIIRDSLVVFRTRKCMFFARRRNCHEFYLKISRTATECSCGSKMSMQQMLTKAFFRFKQSHQSWIKLL